MMDLIAIVLTGAFFLVSIWLLGALERL